MLKDETVSYLKFVSEIVFDERIVIRQRFNLCTLDWNTCHYVKILMDEIFEKENFINEIVWYYRRWSDLSKAFQKMHDTIFFTQKAEIIYLIDNILHLLKQKRIFLKGIILIHTKNLMVQN